MRLAQIAYTLPVVAALFAGCANPEAPGPQRITGTCMGTTWSAILTDTPGRAAEAQRVIQAELDRVDGALSTWKEGSDLSRIKRAPSGEAVPIQEVTYQVLRASDRWVQETGGAFDPTIGPLVTLWGFSDQDMEGEEPSADAVETAKAKLGWSELEVTESAVTKGRDEIAVDASAIAKGYGVDLAARALEGAGFPAFLLEVGGEIVVRGNRSGGELWRVGIDDPLPPEGSDPASPMRFAPRPHIARLNLTDCAVATSGDYLNVRVRDGRTVTHAIDPRTGQPIQHDLASVTVVAEDCASADALATAALVLGPEDALELLERTKNVEGLLLIRGPNGDPPLVWKETSGLSKYRLERR